MTTIVVPAGLTALSTSSPASFTQGASASTENYYFDAPAGTDIDFYAAESITANILFYLAASEQPFTTQTGTTPGTTGTTVMSVQAHAPPFGFGSSAGFTYTMPPGSTRVYVIVYNTYLSITPDDSISLNVSLPTPPAPTPVWTDFVNCQEKL